MPIPENLRRYWHTFALATGEPDDARFYEAFAFGDNERLAHELADLVLQGVKQATAGSAWVFEAQGKPLPKAGDLSIVTNWAGDPLCIIETTSVDIVPFDQVSAEFAATEGEGDGSLPFWQAAHARYFARECRRIGRSFQQDMPVVCERFQVVYRPSAG